jgi:hypothetical protein
MQEMGQEAKFTLQFLVALIVHPLALLLMWVNLAARSDMGPRMKMFWVMTGFIWLFGPLTYISVGGGQLW